MGSGLARGAKARGKRIAFGDGKRIIWGPHSAGIFRGNDNIAPPGSEKAPDIEWVAHYAGHRLNTPGVSNGRWTWLPFGLVPGEVVFDQVEKRFGGSFGKGFVVIEPRVKRQYPNKQWPQERYRAVAQELQRKGLRVVQFSGAAPPVDGCGEVIKTPTFRHALAVLSHAALYVGAEGGLHHGAAAVGTKAVVIFGGWPDPRSTGYDGHRNLAAADAGCGTVAPCGHCRAAMAAISVEQVVDAAMQELSS